MNRFKVVTTLACMAHGALFAPGTEGRRLEQEAVIMFRGPVESPGVHRSFKERSAGQPEALWAWFHPGGNWGELFTLAGIILEFADPIKPEDAPVAMEPKPPPIKAGQTNRRRGTNRVCDFPAAGRDISSDDAGS